MSRHWISGRYQAAIGLAASAGLAVAFALGVGGCDRDPAVAPFMSSGEARVALVLVDGALSEPPAVKSPAPVDWPAGSSLAPCEVPPVGFPEDVTVGVVVNPPAGGLIIRSFEVPARTEEAVLVVDGLAPGNGYVVEVEVQAVGSKVFEGVSQEFAVLPGGRTEVEVELSPPAGRRTVLAVGAPQVSDTGALVPVLLSHSIPLRGLEFDLCFDPEVLEPLGARAVGSRVGGFRGSGGQPGIDGIYHAILWSPDAEARLEPGRDQVLELQFGFRTPNPIAFSNLIFVNAFAIDDVDSLAFTTYFFDGQVQR
jgi:hypothetical protein